MSITGFYYIVRNNSETTDNLQHKLPLHTHIMHPGKEQVYISVESP